MTTEDQPTVSSPAMVDQKNLFAIRRDSVINELSAVDICKMFNDFLTEFEKMEKNGITTTQMFLDAVEEITDAVLAIKPYKLLDPKVLLHPLILFLHQVLVDILHNWRASQLRLNIQETDIFLKIVLIFVHAAEQAPPQTAEEDRKRIRDIVATKRFLFLVREQIDDCTRSREEMNDDPNICTLALLTFKLLYGSPFYYSPEQNERLINDLIMNCLDSYDYLQALRQLQRDEQLTDIDRLLLFTCWEHIPFVSTMITKTPKMRDPAVAIHEFYDELLIRLEKGLNEPPPNAPLSYAYIFERYNQLLNIQNLPSFDKHANFIIDYLINILQKPSSTNPNDEKLVTIALEAFHNLTKNTDIRTLMKKRQLASIFNKYTSNDMGDNRKFAFDILAEIMDEKEINNNSTEMTGIFIEQLNQLNPNEYNPNADSALASLQGLMQHEQVKNEFIKQGGVDKLINFVRDGDLSTQSDTQLEDTLKILLSCTFNNPEILTKLQQDTALMTRVDQIHSKAVHNENSALEKAAEGLIWKVEKEEKFAQQQAETERKKQEKKQKAKESGVEEEEEEEESEQYDLMISYSWADMDLAHRIFKHLTEKLGYKIWLDQEQMHGSTIGAMASAVENAQFILMCMSETYKRSANCQSEAEYAFNRKKHIVPIKMKKDYVPDGWLGFILGTRMYIDFGTYEFDKAIKLLDNEIQLQKKKRKEAKEVARAQRKSISFGEDTKGEKEEVLTRKNDGSKISNWDKGNVRDFLAKHNLPSMLRLCDGINGEELFTLYTMCKTNPTLMYRSLKSELQHGHNRILPISTFLRFISRMKAICDDELPSKNQIVSKIHEEPSQTDD